MRQWKTKKTVETSKKLLIFASVLAVGITIATFVATFITGDVSPLEFVIVGCYGLVSTSYAFYFWKAKNENIQKYGFKELEEDEDEDCT